MIDDGGIVAASDLVTGVDTAHEHVIAGAAEECEYLQGFDDKVWW
jgi:hypothetical protein